VVLPPDQVVAAVLLPVLLPEAWEDDGINRSIFKIETDLDSKSRFLPIIFAFSKISCNHLPENFNDEYMRQNRWHKKYSIA
jgi:hypothetical protein